MVGPLPDPEVASRIVLLDAFVANVDRTPRNANLLSWHDRVWLIDHGASLYVHHGWTPEHPLEGVEDPFPEVRDHVLLPEASALREAAAHLEATLVPARIDEVVAQVPPSWLEHDRTFADVAAQRAAYRRWLTARIRTIPRLVEEAERARAQRV